MPQNYRAYGTRFPYGILFYQTAAPIGALLHNRVRAVNIEQNIFQSQRDDILVAHQMCKYGVLQGRQFDP